MPINYDDGDANYVIMMMGMPINYDNVRFM
jgi:hypothetical protein